MENTFDYAKAMAELEETKLEQLDSLISRSKVLIKACRDYLRGIQEKIDSL